MNQSVDQPLASLPVTVAERTEASVTVVLPDGQRVTIPNATLPETATIGSTVFLCVLTVSDMESEREQIARTILNRLLKQE